MANDLEAVASPTPDTLSPTPDTLAAEALERETQLKKTPAERKLESLQKLSASRPKTDDEREHFKRVSAINALNGLNCPTEAGYEERIAAIVARLMIEEGDVVDPTDPRPDTDRGRRTLPVAFVRVADKDGQPRTTTDLSTGAHVYFPIEGLIKELFQSEPRFRWAERFPS